MSAYSDQNTQLLDRYVIDANALAAEGDAWLTKHVEAQAEFESEKSTFLDRLTKPIAENLIRAQDKLRACSTVADIIAEAGGPAAIRARELDKQPVWLALAKGLHARRTVLERMKTTGLKELAHVVHALTETGTLAPLVELDHRVLAWRAHVNALTTDSQSALENANHCQACGKGRPAKSFDNLYAILVAPLPVPPANNA